MMTSKKIFLLVAVLAPAFLFTSCDDDEFGNPPPLTSLEGRVFTQNEFGQPLYDERSGVGIYLETEFRNFNLQGNNEGVYRLANIPTGTYMMRYSKEDYGTIERRGLRVINTNPQFEILEGYQQIPSVTLTKLPTTSFNNVQAVLAGDPDQDIPFTLTISATMVPPPPPTGQAKGYRIFVGVGNSVSKENYIFQKHITTTVEDLQEVLEEQLFNIIPNTPGSVLSVVLYGDANFDETYEDDTDRVIFPNLSVEPSAVVSVIIP